MKERGKAELSDWIGELDDGDYMLVAYKKEGMCWSRRGEFPVTNRLRADLDQNPVDELPQPAKQSKAEAYRAAGIMRSIARHRG